MEVEETAGKSPAELDRLPKTRAAGENARCSLNMTARVGQFLFTKSSTTAREGSGVESSTCVVPRSRVRPRRQRLER